MGFLVSPPDGEPAYAYVGRLPPPGLPPSNCSSEDRDVVIHDFRGDEASFSLDVHGFCAAAIPSPLASEALADLRSRRFAMGEEPEVQHIAQAILSTVLPNCVVHLFSAILRSADPKDTGSLSRPAARVHVDQTHAMGIDRIKLLPPHFQQRIAAENLRVRIVNVWIPLNENPETLDFPLALGDSRSCPESLLVPVKTYLRAREGENASVVFDERLKFYYLSGMRMGEVLLVKCFDSVCNEDGTYSRSPHGSFRDPRVSVSQDSDPNGLARGVHRTSVEMRCIVVDVHPSN
ncbi:hypothetical protein HDU82_000821 [Entophlyctis luteolus]|nr:hypothetical protein HDU82_000821 [Entophlyctis luteolus]